MPDAPKMRVLTIKLTDIEAKVALEALAAMRREHRFGHKTVVLDMIDQKLWDAADRAGLAIWLEGP